MLNLKDAARKELEQIERKFGLIPVAEVIKRAKNKNSALHDYYEWDINEAAQKHWEQRTREIIRSYTVLVTIEGSSRPVPTRAYVSLATERGPEGGYRSLVNVIDNADRRAQLLADAYAELRSFQRKYATLTELSGIFKQIAIVLDKQAAEDRPAA